MRAGEKEQRGGMEKRWMRIWEGKVKKSTWDLKLFHLMVLKGIDGQKEEAQKGIKREETMK